MRPANKKNDKEIPNSISGAHRRCNPCGCTIHVGFFQSIYVARLRTGEHAGRMARHDDSSLAGRAGKRKNNE